MKKRHPCVFLVALLALGVTVAAPGARAVSLGGRASTQALWFSDEAERDHFDLAQYLRFHARGFEPSDTLSVSGYGRAWGDVEQGGGVEGRLYYLYLDKKELVRRTDVRVGRQFFFLSAGSAIVDGARVDTRPFSPVGLTLVGGRNVLFGATGEDTRSGDIAAAAQLSVTPIPGGSASLSYLVTYDESDLAQEIVGLEANQRIGTYGELYTQMRLDLLSEVWNEILVGARSGYVPKLHLNAEFFRFIPVFDASSIYSVFAVDRFQEVMLRAQYDLTASVSLSGEYRNESYGGGDTANAGELGVLYKPRDGSRYSVYGAGILRRGTGGDLLGFELSGDFAPAKGYVLAAGAQYDVYQRDLMTGDESASRVWLGGSARILSNVSTTARLEANFNENFDSDLRARLALNVDF